MVCIHLFCKLNDGKSEAYDDAVIIVLLTLFDNNMSAESSLGLLASALDRFLKAEI